MIDYYLFDLGRVLIDFDFKIAIANLRKRCRLDLFKVHSLFYNSTLARDWDQGLLTPDKFYEAIQERLRLPLDMEEFIPIWNGIFSEKKDMIALARELSKRNKVAILSNTNPWHAEHIRKSFAWVRDFHDFIASCDVHLMKPDPEIFTLALKRADARPSGTLYIDDIPEHVRQAKKMGIDALVFKNYSQIVEEMKLRGIPL